MTRFKKAPSKALVKNTFDGENLSAIVKMAKVKVPMINPNYTTEVNKPKALLFRLKFSIKSLITPFPANQRVVQQN